MASQSIPSMTTEGTSNASVDMDSREKAFFTAPTFAVVGASNDDSKAGAQIVKYLKTQFGDNVIIPVNPNRTEIQGLKCIKSIMDLSDAKHTAVSIVVNSKVTLEVLQQAKQLGIPYLWLQPGTQDAAVIAFIQADADFESRCIYTLPFSTNQNSGPTIDPCHPGQSLPLAKLSMSDFGHNSAQNNVVIGALSTSRSTSPALDIVHNSGQNGIAVDASSTSHSMSSALDMVHNSGQNGVVIGASSTSHSTSPALDIVHNSGQNGAIIDTPSTSRLTSSTRDFVHNPAQNAGLVASPSSNNTPTDFDHGSGQNPVPPSEETVVKRSSLTKRSREIESIDTKSLKAAKTGPTSSPVTARSTNLHFALVKKASTALEEFKDALLQKEQHFWAATKYAVIGASSDEHKFGYKCMKFLQDQKKDVVPINPNADEVLGVKCLDSIAELSDPAHTAVSVVVHPEVTLDVLKYISQKKLSLFSLWLQPGAEDPNVLKFIKDNGMEDYCVHAIGGSGPISISSSPTTPRRLSISKKLGMSNLKTATTATAEEAADSVSSTDTTGPGCLFVINNPSLLNMGTGANVDADGDKMEVSESMAVPERIKTMTSAVTKKRESVIAAVRSAAANVQMHVPCILADGPKCLAAVMGKGDAQVMSSVQVKGVRKRQTQCDEIPGLA